MTFSFSDQRIACEPYQLGFNVYQAADGLLLGWIYEHTDGRWIAGPEQR